MVMFASNSRKDTIEFVEETGEFVCNLAVWDLRVHVKDTSLSFPRGINEMAAVGLELAPSVLVKPPRVKASPCALECKYLQTVRLIDLDNKPAPRFIAFGQVVGIHIDERFIKDGLLDTAAMKPISRAGYQSTSSLLLMRGSLCNSLRKIGPRLRLPPRVRMNDRISWMKADGGRSC